MEIKISDLTSSIGSLSGDVLKAQSKAEAAADNSFENMLTAALNANDDKRLKDACTQFEEMMIGMIYKQMKATIIRAEEAKDPGRDLYEQWQDEAMVKEMAKNGSFGLANMMYKQLSKRMENEYILNED